MDISASGTVEKMIETTPISSSARGVPESFRTLKPSTSLYIIEEESIVDIEFEKQASKIDYKKMNAKVIKEHPHKPNGIPYTFKDVLFKFKIGRHSLFSSSSNSDLDKFGIGITLYFKLLKHLLLFFFIFILLSIPAYIFYVAAYVQYYDSSSSVNYLDVITSTTVGSIGMGSKACSLGRHPDFGTADQAMLQFSCTDGNIADVGNINFGFVQLGSQCDYILQDDITNECNVYDLSKLRPAFKDCDGQPRCTIPISKNLFIPRESSTYCNKIYQLMMVYMQITCISRGVEVKSDANPVLKSKIAYIVTTLDAVIVIIFLVMIISLKYAQSSAVKNLLQKTYTASSYSVQIHNLPQKSSQQETCAEVWTMLRNKLGQDQQDIIDVQIIPPYQLIEYMRSLEDLKITKGKYVNKFIEHFMPNSKMKHLKQSQMKDIILDLENTKHAKLKKAQKIFEIIQKLNVKQKSLKSKITSLETDPRPKLDTAFVTFNNIETKNKILDIFTPPSKLQTFFKKSLDQKALHASSVDEPGAIIWENIGTPKRTIFFRRSLSFLCALLLWAITAIIVTISTYYQNDMSSKYPSINCQDQNPTEAQTATDYNLGDYQAGLVVCYCSADISGRKHEVFEQVNNEQLCLTWYRNKVAIEVVSWVIVVAILVINYAVEFAFVALSNFEKHASVTKKLSERTIKMFVCEFLNTGLVILIINIKSSISWWQGDYNDLSPLWYSNVGSTIVLALFLNAFSDPSVIIFQITLKKIIRWIDRKFSKDRGVTRKKKQADYEKLYTGPNFSLDTRYVQILTITFVCFLYGSGMPILYFTTFIQLMVTYFVDKYHLLKFCKTPETFGHNLETVVRRAMYAAVLLHLPFAIFIFGESTLFVDGITTTSGASTANSIKTNAVSNNQNVVQKFFKRAGYKYNSIFVVIFFIVVILYFFKILFNKFPLIQMRIRKNLKKKYLEKAKVKTGSNDPLFLQLLKPTDIEVLIKTTKKDIKNVEDARLVGFLNEKLQTLEKATLQKKDQEDIQKQFKFVGSHSYDFRLNESTEEESEMRKIVSRISSKFL